MLQPILYSLGFDGINFARNNPENRTTQAGLITGTSNSSTMGRAYLRSGVNASQKAKMGSWPIFAEAKPFAALVSR